jgi:hypothetical protein
MVILITCDDDRSRDGFHLERAVHQAISTHALANYPRASSVKKNMAAFSLTKAEKLQLSTRPPRACESLRRACHTVSTPSLAHSFIRELSLFLSVCCGAGSSSRSSSGKLHGRSPRRRAVLTPAQVPRLICASRAADLPLTRRQHRKATRYFEPGHTTLGT